MRDRGVLGSEDSGEIQKNSVKIAPEWPQTQTQDVFMTLTGPAACETSGFLKGIFKASVDIKGVCLVEYFLTYFHLSWKKSFCCLAISWYTSCAK